MVVTAASLSRGPKLVHGEKGVHIIHLVTDSSDSGAGGAPPAKPGAPPVTKNIGMPAPTDILVYDHKPWHYVAGAMRDHPKVHHEYPETILKVKVEKEKAVWWSEKRFDITAVAPSHLDAHPGPDPFDTLPATEEAIDAAGRKIYVAKSKEPKRVAKDHIYKITFKTGGEDIDPDMSCTP